MSDNNYLRIRSELGSGREVFLPASKIEASKILFVYLCIFISLAGIYSMVEPEPAIFYSAFVPVLSFFVLMTINQIKLLVTNRAGMKIDEGGFKIVGVPFFSTSSIQWDEINEMNIKKDKYRSYLRIYLNDPKGYIEIFRGGSYWTRKLQNLIFRTPALVPSRVFKLKLDDLFELLVSYWRQKIDVPIQKY